MTIWSSLECSQWYKPTLPHFFFPPEVVQLLNYSDSKERQFGLSLIFWSLLLGAGCVGRVAACSYLDNPIQLCLSLTQHEKWSWGSPVGFSGLPAGGFRTASFYCRGCRPRCTKCESRGLCTALVTAAQLSYPAFPFISLPTPKTLMI